MKLLKIAVWVLAGGLLSAACASPDTGSSTDGHEENTEKGEIQGEWISLFDGESLRGWHGYNKSGAVENWIVEDSALHCLGMTGGSDFGGDLVSDSTFANFELYWEWKISEGGNSGLMYHVVEDEKYKAPYETGPEFQMIDDIGFPSALENWQKTGANYAMNAADEQKKRLQPVGEWNTSRIIYKDGKVEHWLNGELIVDFEEGTDQWNEEKTTGKWKDFPDYKIANQGKIALQDHGDSAWFKNIRIRKL